MMLQRRQQIALIGEDAGRSRRRQTILVVDDEDEVRELILLVLETGGYRLLDAPGGTRALKIGTSFQEPIHLLITDVLMPGMTGPEVARVFLELHPESEVLYVSGYADKFVLRRGAPSRKEHHFLKKPFTGAALARLVREILERPSPAIPEAEHRLEEAR